MIFGSLLVFCCIGKIYGQSYTLPSYFSVCYRDDPNLGSCIKNKIETLMPIFKSGAREFDLAPLDPWDFYEGLNFTFKTTYIGGSFSVPKVELRGLSTLKVLDVRPKVDNPKKFALDFDVDLDELRIKLMPYTLDGHVDKFSVKFGGNLDLKFNGMPLTYHLECDVIPRNGRDFLHLTSFKWRMRNDVNDIKAAKLMNEDVVFNYPFLNGLVKPILRLTWRAIGRASLPTFLPTIDLNLKNSFTNFFLKYPYDVLLPKTKV